MNFWIYHQFIFNELKKQNQAVHSTASTSGFTSHVSNANCQTEENRGIWMQLPVAGILQNGFL
jgi:hypothetical protein